MDFKFQKAFMGLLQCAKLKFSKVVIILLLLISTSSFSQGFGFNPNTDIDENETLSEDPANPINDWILVFTLFGVGYAFFAMNKREVSKDK